MRRQVNKMTERRHITNDLKMCKSTYFDVSIDQPVEFDVIIIFAEWIDQHFGNFEPADKKRKLLSEWEKKDTICVGYSIGAAIESTISIQYSFQTLFR